MMRMPCAVASMTTSCPGEIPARASISADTTNLPDAPSDTTSPTSDGGFVRPGDRACRRSSLMASRDVELSRTTMEQVPRLRSGIEKVEASAQHQDAARLAERG